MLLRSLSKYTVVLISYFLRLVRVETALLLLHLTAEGHGDEHQGGEEGELGPPVQQGVHPGQHARCAVCRERVSNVNISLMKDDFICLAKI